MSATVEYVDAEVIEAEIVEELTEDQALALVDELKQHLGRAHEVYMRLIEGRAWIALGYRDGPEMLLAICDGPLRLARADRGSLVAALAGQGHSTRVIASTLGVSQTAVSRDLRPSNVTAGGVSLKDSPVLTGTVIPSPRPTAPVTDWQAERAKDVARAEKAAATKAPKLRAAREAQAAEAADLAQRAPLLIREATAQADPELAWEREHLYELPTPPAALLAALQAWDTRWPGDFDLSFVCDDEDADDDYVPGEGPAVLADLLAAWLPLGCEDVGERLGGVMRILRATHDDWQVIVTLRETSLFMGPLASEAAAGGAR